MPARRGAEDAVVRLAVLADPLPFLCHLRGHVGARAGVLLRIRGSLLGLVPRLDPYRRDFGRDASTG